MLNDDYCKWW